MIGRSCATPRFLLLPFASWCVGDHELQRVDMGAAQTRSLVNQHQKNATIYHYTVLWTVAPAGILYLLSEGHTVT